MNGEEMVRSRFKQRESSQNYHGLELSKTTITFPMQRGLRLPLRAVKQLTD